MHRQGRGACAARNECAVDDRDSVPVRRDLRAVGCKSNPGARNGRPARDGRPRPCPSTCRAGRRPRPGCGEGAGWTPIPTQTRSHASVSRSTSSRGPTALSCFGSMLTHSESQVVSRSSRRGIRSRAADAGAAELRPTRLREEAAPVREAVQAAVVEHDEDIVGGGVNVGLDEPVAEFDQRRRRRPSCSRDTGRNSRDARSRPAGDGRDGGETDAGRASCPHPRRPERLRQG